METRRETPGDSEHTPPEGGGHQEEVEGHSQDGTPPVVKTSLPQSPLCDQARGTCWEGIVAGNGIILTYVDQIFSFNHKYLTGIRRTVMQFQVIIN